MTKRKPDAIAKVQNEVREQGLPEPVFLKHDEIADLLPLLDQIISWARQVQEYALKAALRGSKFNGYKLVKGRSMRGWKNDARVASILLNQGFNKAMIYDQKLVSVATLEKIIGKKQVAQLLGQYIYKAPEKPTLVKESDRRPAINSADGAKSDFQIEDE